jgi:hypothetical protein
LYVVEESEVGGQVESMTDNYWPKNLKRRNHLEETVEDGREMANVTCGMWCAGVHCTDVAEHMVVSRHPNEDFASRQRREFLKECTNCQIFKDLNVKLSHVLNDHVMKVYWEMEV